MDLKTMIQKDLTVKTVFFLRSFHFLCFAQDTHLHQKLYQMEPACVFVIVIWHWPVSFRLPLLWGRDGWETDMLLITEMKEWDTVEDKCIKQLTRWKEVIACSLDELLIWSDLILSETSSKVRKYRSVICLVKSIQLFFLCISHRMHPLCTPGDHHHTQPEQQVSSIQVHICGLSAIWINRLTWLQDKT